LLAVTIGNVHGKYALPPRLDFPRFKKIQQNILSFCGKEKMPFFVLHGASGLPSDLIHLAINSGIVKFNVNTDLRTAAIDKYRQLLLLSEQKTDLLDIMKAATNIMQNVAEEKIRLFKNRQQS
jgi:fructose/tagatose bisphosphate aldolase